MNKEQIINRLKNLIEERKGFYRTEFSKPAKMDVEALEEAINILEHPKTLHDMMGHIVEDMYYLEHEDIEEVFKLTKKRRQENE